MHNYRDVVQLVACVLWEHEVVGSSPAIPTEKVVNRVVGELVTPPDLGSGELAGSNPAYPTVLDEDIGSLRLIVTQASTGSIPA